MYKDMIPADIVARETQLRPAAHRANESPATQGLPGSGNGDALLQKELMEWKERCLRLAAEFENFRKRAARETERQAAEQKTSFVRDLLPVVDNLERALANSPTHSPEQLREGVELTLRQLTQVLNQHGFTSRTDIGRPFDPQFHEAMRVGYEPMCADHIILEVWQRGWLRGKELFRPAKVVVNDLKCSSTSENHENIQHEKGANRG